MILRLNPLLLVVVAVMGVASFVVAFRAFTSYHDAAEAFTQVEMQYVPDSFRWDDPAFESATATFKVVNSSSFPATLESFSVALNFDGAFAGSDYSRWIPINIPAGREPRCSSHLHCYFEQHTGRGRNRHARLYRTTSFHVRGF